VSSGRRSFLLVLHSLALPRGLL
jgi:hypothetical protein